MPSALNLLSDRVSNRHQMLFDLIGKLFYARLPQWQRRRNAKVLVLVAFVAVLVAAIIVSLMWFINNHIYK